MEPIRSQPAGSKIEVDRFDGGLTIRVPPAGLWKGTSGLFFFALLWNGFMTLFTSSAVCAGLQAENKPDETALWVFPLFLSLFWAVGIGLLLGSLNMGRRSAMFAVAGGNLLVMQKGIFGTRQREWPAKLVSSVRTGSSGVEVNDRPVLELQIHDRVGKKFGLLAGRKDEELEWLAAELGRAIREAQQRTTAR